jgi:hypothetical protein
MSYYEFSDCDSSDEDCHDGFYFFDKNKNEKPKLPELQIKYEPKIQSKT